VVTPLRLLFFGTPDFAVPSLRIFAGSQHAVVGAITQPDRPRGRGQKVSASPVKAAATELGIPVFQPTRLKDESLAADLRALAPDLGIVAAYGRILPDALLHLPRLGMINVHASLLPRWRGAAPIQRAILAGDRTTGVTIMRVIQQLDAGPMLATVPTPIDPHETSADLESRLAQLGAALLGETVEALARGPVLEIPQDPGLVTYAARIERRDGTVSFSESAETIHNAIRGLQPWPLVWSRLHGKRIALLSSEPLPDESSTATPGTVVRVESDALVAATGRGLIRLTRVQLEGRPAMAVRDFLNGHPTRAGEQFDSATTAAS
jgi:methionyl-tRNA formyltransferase